MYVIEDAGKLLLIDMGNGSSLDPFLAAFEQVGLNQKNITTVLITHEHLDHVLGLYPLMRLFNNQNIQIYAHPITAAILREGNEEMICPSMLGISASQFGVEIKPLKVETVDYKKGFTFGSIHFEIFETPGHSLGSVSYYEPKLKILFGGDVVFPHGSFGRYDFPGGDLKKLQNSIKVLSGLDVEYLCAGHMEPVRNGKRHIQNSLKVIMSLYD
jgi:hydroxyacylglutathione hydrolase